MIDVKNIVEEWKDIAGYEGHYQVSNLGRVKNVKRIVRNNKVEYRAKEKILKPHKNRGGYVQLVLCKDGICKTAKAHRLVANEFIKKDDETFQVNHKDENKLNNRVDNLEWISRLENMRYGTGIERRNVSNSKPIAQIDLNGNVIKVWESATEVRRTLGFSNQHVSEVCSGKNKTAYGFRWKFV